MPDYTRFQLADGTWIAVEDTTASRGVERVSRKQPRNLEEVQKATETLSEALTRVRGVVHDTLSELRTEDNGPAEVEIQFGVTLSAELGAVVTKAGGETTLQVRLLWQRSEER